MNFNQATLLLVALLVVLSPSTLAAALPNDPPSSATGIPAALPVQPSVPQVGNEQVRAPEQIHQAPPAVAARGKDATPQEQAASVAHAANPADASGFRLLDSSSNALLSRVSLEDQAQHSIDMQYYIFENDATGRLIALHLLQAADRGVHVRILLDDLNLDDEVRMFRALASNPNIEVKLFNPFDAPHPNLLSRAVQLALEFRRLNRRMHNKSFIVDNYEAVIGGRNIGNAYFNDSVESNFRDLDVLAIGPVVPEATRSFEAYWNSDAAHSISGYHSNANPAADLVVLRARLRNNARTFDASAYMQEAADVLPSGVSAVRPGRWFWGPAALVADQPAKIETGRDRKDLRIGPRLEALIDAAQSEVLVISPYFIPSKRDVGNFIGIAQRGVPFKVLTNSLASTDEVIVHAGYVGRRRPLLAGGVEIFELKPTSRVGPAISDAGKSAGVSLHAKAFVVDRRYVFIGSMNMDQRSKLLNTEMGVVVDSPQLAKAVADFFAQATSPANAFHVVLRGRDGVHGSDMHWEATSNGKAVDYDHEPDASLHRRMEVQLLKLLPIDGLL